MDICKINFCELTFGITALANSIAKDLEDEEVLLMSRIFSQLSSTLITIASLRELCEIRAAEQQTAAQQTQTQKTTQQASAQATQQASAQAAVQNKASDQTSSSQQNPNTANTAQSTNQQNNDSSK
jgi:hypothetical protein